MLTKPRIGSYYLFSQLCTWQDHGIVFFVFFYEVEELKRSCVSCSDRDIVVVNSVKIMLLVTLGSFFILQVNYIDSPCGFF